MTLQVGVCIVDSGHKIVGIGHNKMPERVNEETFPYWDNRSIRQDGFMQTKYPYGEHYYTIMPCYNMQTSKY